MTKKHRPDCPKCGGRMWKIHDRPELKCPGCGYHADVGNPRLRIWRTSYLADLRREMVK